MLVFSPATLKTFLHAKRSPDSGSFSSGGGKYDLEGTAICVDGRSSWKLLPSSLYTMAEKNASWLSSNIRYTMCSFPWFHMYGPDRSLASSTSILSHAPRGGDSESASSVESSPPTGTAPSSGWVPSPEVLRQVRRMITWNRKDLLSTSSVRKNRLTRCCNLALDDWPQSSVEMIKQGP